MFAALALLAWRAPRVPVVRQPAAAWVRAFATWLSRPGAGAVLTFIVLYKLGDVSMGPMVKPFWLDSGLSVDDVALVSTTVGVGLTVAGALVGGLFTSRYGIFRGLWALGLLQALSNLGYAGAAAVGGGRAAIYAASMLESFTGGLGTAAFLAFLMHQASGTWRTSSDRQRSTWFGWRLTSRRVALNHGRPASFSPIHFFA
jgi:PAT family beta-lactamase induction signal transducer AmpG